MYVRGKKDLISIKIGDYYHVKKLENIMYICANGSYLDIYQYTRAGTPITVAFTLKEIAVNLSADFVRIHKSTIINVRFVTKFAGNLVYINERYFAVSKMYKASFIEQMNILGYPCKLLK